MFVLYKIKIGIKETLFGNYSYKFDGYSINSGMGNNKGRGRVRRR